MIIYSSLIFVNSLLLIEKNITDTNITDNNSTINLFSSILNFGGIVDNLINAIIGAIIIIFFALILVHNIQKRFKIKRLKFIEKPINFLIENAPSSFLKSFLSKLFDIESETFILLPKPSERNYQHLAYQLNGINRFLETNNEYKGKIKIILINNSTIESTNDTLKIFIETLSENKRYIIIATMSDIFDALLRQIGRYRFEDRNYRKMIKIIGALASQSEKYRNYERYDNIIRLSPPDFDEARKASFNIMNKLISSFCPSKTCEYHKNNNIIIISSNSYGDAVKKSFLKLFAEHKEEFDTNTNINVDAKELDRGIFKFTYHFDIHNGGIREDDETNYSFDVLLEERTNNAINTIFIIGYEPNISNILLEIDKQISLKKLDNSEFSILISATISLREWRNAVIKTFKNLSMRDKISEVNFIKIKYPRFYAEKDSYISTKKHYKLYEINNKGQFIQIENLEFKQDEMNKIIYKKDMNYINGFMYMSMEFVKQLNMDWSINLLSLKEKLFHNKDINDKDILGVKILSSGDSINHFKIQRLKLD
jgi:hypothetical protein